MECQDKSGEHKANVDKWFEYYCSAPDSVKELADKVSSFGWLFDDMIFAEMSDEAYYGSLPENLVNFDYCLYRYKVEEMAEGKRGYYVHKDKELTISSSLTEEKQDVAILHEMIHLHENALNESHLLYHDFLFWHIYQKLKNKIPNIDKIINDNASLINFLDIAEDGGEHDLLFFFKSLDLDFEMGYKLGTIFGYGMQEAINSQNI